MRRCGQIQAGSVMSFPIFVQLPLAVAGTIASWFVAEGTIRHTLFQVGIALMMLAIVLILCLYLANAVRWLLRRLRSH